MGTLAVVELPYRTGLPKDKVVNTFAIAEADPGAGTHYAAYMDALVELYTSAITSLGGSIGIKMHGGITRAASGCSIKLYDITGHLDGSPHGSPVALRSFTLPNDGGSTPLPAECAVCVTLEAEHRADQLVEHADGADPDAKPDRPRQRYTGRVYMGPWSNGQCVPDANGMDRPAAALMVGLRDGFKRLADNIDTASADESAFGVWSRKDKAIRGWEFIRTDDAFDTQRRRGAQPTAVTRLRVSDLVPEVELAA